MIPVPVLTPRLSSLWLGLVTPVYARVGPRAGGGPAQRDRRARPRGAASSSAIRPRGVREAIARALVNEDREFAATRWSDALSSGPGAARRSAGPPSARAWSTRASPACRCRPRWRSHPIQRIGGRQGWYYGNALWRLRGLLDLPFGGAGTRRGRRDPRAPAARRHGRLLAGRGDRARPPAAPVAPRCACPGRAWLQFEVEPTPGGSIIRQTAIFDPVGLLGPALLVRDLADPRLRLPRDDPRASRAPRRTSARRDRRAR